MIFSLLNNILLGHHVCLRGKVFNEIETQMKPLMGTQRQASSLAFPIQKTCSKVLRPLICGNLATVDPVRTLLSLK